MPMQPQEQESLNVKLVHATKQNSPEEPVQFAFSIVDEQGKEEIITAEVPYSSELFNVFQQQGWVQHMRRGVSAAAPRPRRLAQAG
jgi:hypothetical protein